MSTKNKKSKFLLTNTTLGDIITINDAMPQSGNLHNFSEEVMDDGTEGDNCQISTDFFE